MLGCLAHCRRKIFESRIENEELATCALNQIRLLYAVESEADNANLSYDERKKLREEKSLPIFKNLKEWLLKTEGTVLPNSLIGKAINIYPKLIRTTCSGKYNLDNNKVENVIRPIAQGRRNFMFCGNDKATIRAAIMYSFIGTCRASDINPVDWFADVLNKLPEYTSSGADMAPLLPIKAK